MIRHYLKIAVRNLARNKLFALINLLSLSIGLASFFLFLLYLVNETTYDRSNAHSKSIYRVYEWSKGQNGNEYTGDAGLYLPLGPALQKDLPDIEQFCRIRNGAIAYLHAGDKKIKLPVMYADADLFELFPFPMRYGSPSTALHERNSVVLTRGNARILFGDEDPVGRTITITTDDRTDHFVVSGVTEDLPSNTSLAFDLLLNLDYYLSTPQGQAAGVSWNFSGFENFVQLKAGSDLADHPERLVAIRKNYFPDEQAEMIKAGLWDGRGVPPVTFRLQPLTDIHIDTRIRGTGSHPAMDAGAIWTLFGIITAILVIGCINFTTLAIGRSSKRSKEIGVRKIIGARRKTILFQFLTESFLLSCIAGAIALLLARWLLPAFNAIMGTRLTLSLFHYQALPWLFLGILVVSGLLAGVYPAFILSGLKILTILKNKVRFSGSNLFTRTLVTMQFVLSIGLIISAIVILQQLTYMRTMDIGFNKDNVVEIDAAGVDGHKALPLFKQLLAGQDDILGITSSAGKFGKNYNTSGFVFQGKHHAVVNFSAETNFAAVMGMHLIAGRMLQAHQPEDTVNSVIVNEAFVRELGLSDQAVLGMRLTAYSRKPQYDPVVVGVVRDYNLFPVKERIVPTLFRQKSDFSPSTIYVRLRPGDPRPALKALRSAWSQLPGDILFDYAFLDEALNTRYQQEIKLGDIVMWAAGICIFLGALGLGGLAFLSSENRLKELAIRKVFGGSGPALLFLVAKDHLRLVFVACIAATGLSWYFLHGWLENYAYRIHLSIWVFLATAAGVMAFTFVLLSATVVRVTFLHPAIVLKEE